MMQRNRAAALALLGFVAGCASVTTPDGERLSMRSPEFRAYVEAVFREQNRVATELAFALEAPDVAAANLTQLEASEQELLSACAGLNEIAVGRREGEAVKGLKAASAARRAPECERATHASQVLLESLGQ